MVELLQTVIIIEKTLSVAGATLLNSACVNEVRSKSSILLGLLIAWFTDLLLWFSLVDRLHLILLTIIVVNFQQGKTKAKQISKPSNK